MLDTTLGCRNLFINGKCLLVSLLIAAAPAFISRANAQTTEQTQERPKMEMPAETPDRGIGRNRLECAGYFRLPPLTGLPEIVGGEQEQEQRTYATGHVVYIEAGTQQGVKEGQEFHIIRPRGFVEKVYRQKKGNLGVFIQEVGALRVVRVKENVSVAQITFSCDPILLGDLLTGPLDRFSPEIKPALTIDRFSDPNGKPIGRVMMARDGREMVSVGDIIYVDIGAEDQAVLGDQLTVYREVGTGNLFDIKNEELARRSDEGFASEQFRGGTFSSQAQRSKDVRDEPGQYRHSPIKTSHIKDKRPEMPRKVVAEAMIINVQVRTATAIIVRAAQEVHTGDFVEVK
jgi:hypothetical protein